MTFLAGLFCGIIITVVSIGIFFGVMIPWEGGAAGIDDWEDEIEDDEDSCGCFDYDEEDWEDS